MKKMRFLILSVILTLVTINTSAQEMPEAQAPIIPEGYVLVDTVVYLPAAVADSTLCGHNVFSVMPSTQSGDAATVNVSQTDAVRAAMDAHIAGNEARTLSGFRVRIFFDNKQTARAASEEAEKFFKSKYHGISAYRSYVNPYFKVTIGDFRTRSEAVQLMRRIQGDFPSAFIVKESIVFPIVDKENAYVIDTIQVLRPISQESLTQ